MSQASSHERRNFFRVKYVLRPISELVQNINQAVRNKQSPAIASISQFIPIFYFQQVKLPLLDISEGGCRLQWRVSENTPEKGQVLKGNLVFHENIEHVIAHLPLRMQYIAPSLQSLANLQPRSFAIEAKVVRIIHSKNSTFSQVCLQFEPQCLLSPHFVRQQELFMMALFRQPYLSQQRKEQELWQKSQAK